MLLYFFHHISSIHVIIVTHLKVLTFINPFIEVLEVLFVGEPSFFKFSVFSLVYFSQEPHAGIALNYTSHKMQLTVTN